MNPEQRAEVLFRDRMAQQYEELVGQRGAYWWYAVREFLLHRMGLHAGGWLYDAGCGVGLYALRIAERFPRVRVLAVDFSAESLRRLCEEARHRGVAERIQAVCADITQWSPPQPVRWVLCTEVLQHLPTAELRQQALQRFAESLLPEGELWLVVARHTRDDRRRGVPKEIDERAAGGYFRMRFTVAEVRQLVRRSGLQLIWIGGAPVPSARYGQRLPRQLWRLAHWIQRLPGSAHIGRVLIVRARRC